MCHGSDAPRRIPQRCPVAAIPRGTRSWAVLLPLHPTPCPVWVMAAGSRLSPTLHAHLPSPKVPGKQDREKDNQSPAVCSLLPHTFPKMHARLKGTSITLPWEGKGPPAQGRGWAQRRGRCVPAPLWPCGTGWVTLAPHIQHRALRKALLTPASAELQAGEARAVFCWHPWALANSDARGSQAAAVLPQHLIANPRAAAWL